MAYFAKLNLNNIVEQVLSVENNELLINGIESEQKGIDFLKSIFGQDTIWKKTSYNTYLGKYHVQVDGKHIISNDQSKSFRKNFAAIGFTYDANRDAFIPKKPFNSWVLNEQTCNWEAPIPMPNDASIDKRYIWNEETLNWTLQNI
jgi:hypothetical protein